MADFQNEDEIEAWLNTQPRDVITVFAARAALRVLPFMSEVAEHSKVSSRWHRLNMLCFWGNAVAMSVGIWPNSATRAAARRVSDTYIFSNVPKSDYGKYDAHHAAILALTTSVGPIDAAARAVRAFVLATRARVLDDTLAEEHIASTYKWASADRELISHGGNAMALSEKPLWQDGKLPLYLHALWTRLKLTLKNQQQDWEVWTDWYEDRIEGSPLVRNIEIGVPENGRYGRVTFPPDDYKDAAIINPKIKAMLDDFETREGLSQDTTAESFTVNDMGIVESQTQETGTELTNTATQREWYDALRGSVGEALSEGDNRLGIARGPLTRFSAALPENISNARVPRVWPRANRLRRMLERHDRTSKDEDFDPQQISDDTADLLREIVGNYNNLRLGDAALNAADEGAISPQDAEQVLGELAILEPLIATIIDEDVADAGAKDALNEILDVTNDDEIATQNDIMGRLQIIKTQNSVRNFVRSLVVWARKNPLQAIPVSAGSIVLAEKIVIYSAKIIAYAEMAMPSMATFISAILRAFGA